MPTLLKAQTDHLYERAGFPQPVQGKWGETIGESVDTAKTLNINKMTRFFVEKWSTRRLV